MKIKPIYIEKIQDDHPRRVFLTRLVDTRNIQSPPSFVYKNPRQVRNSPFQFLSLFLQII